MGPGQVTAQVGDSIKLDGSWHTLWSLPLEVLFGRSSIKPFPEVFSTANQRGYRAAWDIVGNELYLVGFEGQFDQYQDPNALIAPGIRVKDILSSSKWPIFADWYSGSLRIPQGEVLQYVHYSFATVTAADFFIDVQDGIVVGRRIVDNRAAHALLQAKGLKQEQTWTASPFRRALSILKRFVQ